eukprot:CAMPEP_0181170916 /NCGR_PEP_ID=MMETSP1096-20121128/1625_1 /TAXON_ID=156174 ORGANISM="Chrysochromulina ericina, Strain CCMP281" /NCGR_SAMPLE_ID=MMETSP1096 /ASSEMBLY_ACC=CAM_ASM_000453 /LENGTH=192 /DNA_ID=CAMNT_0023258517 /DNA_START=1623 /DNA_END=2197 /DNA_ORIENTATION=+
MGDPTVDQSNYCDAAENVHPGIDGGLCVELDLLEANNHAIQTAIHTEAGGTYGSGRCDRNGCFARVGGPMAPASYKWGYGSGFGYSIDTKKSFDVVAGVTTGGELVVRLLQVDHMGTQHEIVAFNRSMAGNPQGKGVPSSALEATSLAMGKLALVASMWSAPDLSWIDGGCHYCRLDDAAFTISNLHVTSSP